MALDDLAEAFGAMFFAGTLIGCVGFGFICLGFAGTGAFVGFVFIGFDADLVR